jgi:hypothetical protein
MKKMFALTLIAAFSLPAYGIRSGNSVVVSPSNMGINTNVTSKRYGSIWNVWIGATTKLYISNVGTACSIVKTGNTYSVKINAFSKSFSYIQSSGGELSLVKTETINVSKTVRRLVTFKVDTNGNQASLTADVEIQTLVKGVWKTSTPSSTWLKSYACVSNMDTEV